MRLFVLQDMQAFRLLNALLLFAVSAILFMEFWLEKRAKKRKEEEDDNSDPE